MFERWGDMWITSTRCYQDWEDPTWAQETCAEVQQKETHPCCHAKNYFEVQVLRRFFLSNGSVVSCWSTCVPRRNSCWSTRPLSSLWLCPSWTRGRSSPAFPQEGELQCHTWFCCVSMLKTRVSRDQPPGLLSGSWKHWLPIAFVILDNARIHSADHMFHRMMKLVIRHLFLSPYSRPLSVISKNRGLSTRSKKETKWDSQRVPIHFSIT